MTATLADLQAAQTRLITEKEALDLALAKARDEISADQEAARLAAARREALEAMIADMKRRVSEGEASLAAALASLEAAQSENVGLAGDHGGTGGAADGRRKQLTDLEKARLAEAAAAEALRQRLAGSVPI